MEVHCTQDSTTFLVRVETFLLGGLQKWVMDALFKFPKFLVNVAGINKIANNIEVDGPERKSQQHKSKE
jgi:hypothetical protein